MIASASAPQRAAAARNEGFLAGEIE